MDSLEQQRKYAKGLEVRTRIVSAAQMAFAKAGYGATSIMDLAAAAGVTKNQIFHHFAGKEALALAAVEAAGTLWRNEVVTTSQIYPDAGAQLEFMLKRLDELQGQGEPFLRLAAAFSAQLASLPLKLSAATQGFTNEILVFLRGRLKLLKRQGGPGQSYKARELAVYLAAMLLGGEILKGAELDVSGKDVVEFTLDLLRGGQPLSSASPAPDPAPDA